MSNPDSLYPNALYPVSQEPIPLNIRCHWVTVAAIALACFLSAKLSVWLLDLESVPLWCPAGIALAALLLRGYRTWVGVAVGMFLFGVSVDLPWIVAAIAATGTTLEAIGGYWLLRRIQFRPALRSLRDVLSFAAIAVVLTPMINATITASVTELPGLAPLSEFGMRWWRIWLGDGMGILVITPLLLTWLGRPTFRPAIAAIAQKWQSDLRFRRNAIESSVWAGLLVTISWLVFQAARPAAIVYSSLEYLPFPLIVWAALRLGQRGTVLGSLVASVIAILGVVQRSGPFWAKGGGDVQQAVFLLQAFVGVMTLTALVLAAAVAERQQVEDRLRNREASLLNAQRIAQLGSWDLDIAAWGGCGTPISDALHWSDELYRILGLHPGAPFSLEQYLAAVHDADRPRLQECLAQAIGDRVPYRLNYRIVRSDGSERLVTEQVEIRPTGLTGTVQDITERKQAEIALRDSEQRFRGMFEGAAIGIGLDDLQGRIIDSNPALQRLLGYSPDELHQLTFADFTHPADLPAEAERFAAIVAGDCDAYQMEKRHIRKDGQEIWVRLTNSLVRDAAGQPKFTIAMIENITERKQAEAALQQSEARFRVVAETASCAFMIYQGRRLRYVNAATEQITEYSRAELLSMDFWELAHPEFRELVRYRGLARQQGETVPSRYEIQIVTKSGRERWLDFNAGVVELEGQSAGLATAYDITDRKQAEAQLRQSANRERLLAEMAQRIRRSLNLDEILNTTVAEVRQFLQADRVFISQLEAIDCRVAAESIDPHWPSVMTQPLPPEAMQEIRALFEREGTRIINDTEQIEKTLLMQEHYQRCQIRAAIGVPLILDGHLFGVLIVNQCSAPRQWQPFEIALLEQLATHVEIAIQQGKLYRQVQTLAMNLETQVEQRTAELHQRMHELQHLNQVKDLLLHAVAHDLKTPAQGMVMVLNKLRSKCDQEVYVPRSTLNCMIQSSSHQLELLNSLLEKHAAQLSEAVPRRSVSLSAIAQAALATLPTQSATIHNQIPADLPNAIADPAQLQQVYESLLTNALKHNAPGITLTLTATVVEKTSGSTPAAKFLYCTVADNGVGIAPTQHDRLFQLYVRGVDNQHLTGIGLGLHRCRQTIAAHGGEIGVISDLGAGATFWFTLPIA